MSRQPKARKSQTDQKPSRTAAQADDFVSVARRLECDEDKARFEEKLGKIARAKVPETKEKPGR